MRLLLDINVLLDLAFRRPGEPASATIIIACGRQHQGWLAWHTLATLAYLIERQASAKMARAFIGGLLTWASDARPSGRHAPSDAAKSLLLTSRSWSVLPRLSRIVATSGSKAAEGDGGVFRNAQSL